MKIQNHKFIREKLSDCVYTLELRKAPVGKRTKTKTTKKKTIRCYT